MNVYQIVSSLAYGDAIGNDIMAIDEVLKEQGYNTEIYAYVIDKRLKNQAKYFDTLRLEPEDVVIYHKASGSPLSIQFKDMKCRKIMLYHNITPSEFFAPYSKYKAKQLTKGRAQLKGLVNHVDYCLAVSEYNKEELVSIGFNKDAIDILPIIMNYEDYNKEPDQEIINIYSDGKTNLLFTGRVAPNKRQEDVIKAFYYYKTYVDTEARLFLVGSYDGMEKYFAKLKGFVADLKLKDVYFTGHIPFNQILAYYRIADVFVCMSEHEGFCVPLLESMYFNVPIVAYNSTAIPYTLGDGGVLIDQKDYIKFSDTIKEIIINKEYRNNILSKQQKRLEYFSHEHTKEMLKACLDRFIREYYNH